jgi:hypothetical protein
LPERVVGSCAPRAPPSASIADVSSEAVATAAREHAQTEDAGPNSRTGTEQSNPASPFAAGAKRLSAVRPREVMALQRMAGNAAVSRLVAGRRATVQREGPGGGEAHLVRADKAGSGAAEQWTDIVAEGDDPMEKVKAAPYLFRQTDTLKPDEKYKGNAAAFHPDLLAIVYLDYIVIVGRSGPLEVRPQTTPPLMAPRSVVVLADTANFTFWTLQIEENTGQVRAHHDPTLLMYGVQKNAIGMYAFIPGLYLGADLKADIEKGISKATDATQPKPGQNPDWAKGQLSKLKKRRGKGAAPGGPGGTDSGTGLGRQGTGTGGGGTKDDPKAVPGGDGQEKKDGAKAGGPPRDPADPNQPKDPKDPLKPPSTGSSSTPAKNADPAPGERKPGGTVPGDPNAPKSKPLQGDPVYKVITTSDGVTHLQMTIDRASTWITMRDGEGDAALDARVDQALEKLQDSRDPDLHGKLAKPAKSTGFTEPSKGQPGTSGTGAEAAKQARTSATFATPGERIPGARGGANAPAYPARITMGGSQVDAPVTVNGATNAFTMEIDYAAMSFGMQDEVFNRMQTIQFYWELIDVTGKTLAEQKVVGKTALVGSGERIGAGSGAGQGISRDMDAIAEDEQNDIKMMERDNWGWDARAAYLTLIGVSNVVRVVGSLIGSYVSIVTNPLNERSIGFDRTGEFLVRCVATPQVSDAARDDPDNHVIRASSIAALPIRVMDINARAKDSLDEEGNQLAKLEKEVKEAKDEKSRKEAELKLEAAKKATAQAGQAAFKSSVGGIREQLATARLLKKHMDAHVPDKELSAPELWLELALEQRATTVDEMIGQLERQLKTMAGDDAEKGEGQGEHEKWVAAQSGTFKGGIEYRPRVVLASEETGQVTPVLMMLGEAKDSTDSHPKWRLIDISSPSSRDIYEGESGSQGAAGHKAAIHDAFRNFAENNEYGRGTIAIRLPSQLTSEPAYAGVTVDPMMRSAKGGKGRFLQRLQDLATVAEVVGLFVTGPLGAAVAAVGGVAGAVIAVDSLIKRARTGHVVEVGTIFDILGVVGGVASLGGAGAALGRAHLDKLAASGSKMPGWVNRLEQTEKALHIHGMIGNIQQVIVIPMQLVQELNAIEGGTEGERDARRALALLRGFKSGAISVIGAMGGIPTGKEKPGAAAGEPEPSAPKQLPPGHNADAADAHAGGSGPAKPPTQAPVEVVGGTGRPAAEPGGPGAGEHAGDAGGAPKGGEVKTPSADQVMAKALELAQKRGQATEKAIEGGGTGQKPATPDAGATGGAKPTEPGGTSGPKPAEPGATRPGEAQAGHAGTPGAAGGEGGTEKVGPDVARREALIGLAAKAGAKPDAEAQGVRREATTNKAAADQDAVSAVKDSGEFGQLRRDVESMSNLNDGQRSALKSRLQEARVAVTNEHVGKVLSELQKRFPDLEFHVQDLGTVGFNSDRDITIRVTAKDPGAYAKLGESERSGMDRRMVQASAEAVPELYKALEAAGFPANKSLDTNFYTELHEGRIKPADAAEARSIAADQQIVSLTEVLLNTSPEQWKAFVEQQRGMIEGLRGKGTPERDITGLRKRLDAQVSEAEANAKRLVGDATGHPTPDARDAALNKARQDLVAALKQQPPPTARELRQLMADVKLLEPDAYGTRAAVEGVVLGGQTMKGASMEKVQGDGFRTRKQIEHGEGEPGPRRLDPETGELREVSAEDEVGRRRAEGQANVGHQRAGDTGQNSFEQNARRLQVAEAVLGHLLGHLPGPGKSAPVDTSAAAKNLGRIVEAVGEAGIRGKSDGLPHLSAIVAAKGAADSVGAIHKELGSWARESGVKGWAETNGLPLHTDAQRVDAFLAWSREQAMNLTGRMRVRAETGALYDDVPVGTGRSPRPGVATPVVPAAADQAPAGPTGGSPTPKAMPSGEAPVDAGDAASSTAPTHDAAADAVPGGPGAGGDAHAADTGSSATPATPSGSGGGTSGAGTSPRTQTQAEAELQISRLRSRLTAWRDATADAAVVKRIEEQLGKLNEIAAANKRGEAVAGKLDGIEQELPPQR